MKSSGGDSECGLNTGLLCLTLNLSQDVSYTCVVYFNSLLWFDYWLPDQGVCMAYAENPGEFMAPGGFTIRHDLHKPLLANWPNPEVIRVGNLHHSFADPSGWRVPEGTAPDPKAWMTRQLREAVSEDGINWKKLDYI